MTIQRADAAWLAGLIDGEGCFTVYVHDYTDGRIGVTIRLAIELRDDDEAGLKHARKLCGFGTIHYREARGNAHPQVTWAVSGLTNCLRLRTILSAYPPQTKKQRDYALWCEALDVYGLFVRGGPEARARNAPHIARMRALAQQLKKQKEYPNAA